jgi:hypothetical protein
MMCVARKSYSERESSSQVQIAMLFYSLVLYRLWIEMQLVTKQNNSGGSRKKAFAAAVLHTLGLSFAYAANRTMGDR